MKIYAENSSGPLELKTNLLTATLHEKGIRPTTATPLAKFDDHSPAFLINHYGNGRAILLNGSLFSRYTALRKEPLVGDFNARTKAMESLLLSITRLGGLSPRIGLKTRESPRADVYTTYIFSTGKNKYVGFLKFHSGEISQTITLKFADKAFTRELINGETLGWTDRVRMRVGGWHTALFARLAYRVKRIEFKPRKAYRPGELLRASVRVIASSPPELHIICMEVFGPSGKPVEHYAENLLLERGEDETVLPFALNDPRGRWTITLHDIASGIKLTRKISLR